MLSIWVEVRNKDRVCQFFHVYVKGVRGKSGEMFDSLWESDLAASSTRVRILNSIWPGHGSLWKEKNGGRLGARYGGSSFVWIRKTVQISSEFCSHMKCSDFSRASPVNLHPGTLPVDPRGLRFPSHLTSFASNYATRVLAFLPSFPVYKEWSLDPYFDKKFGWHWSAANHCVVCTR